MYMDIKDYVDEYNKENPETPMVYNLVKAAETSWLVSTLTFVVMPMLILGLLAWVFMKKLTIMGDGGRQMGFGRAKIKNIGEKYEF